MVEVVVDVLEEEFEVWLVEEEEGVVVWSEICSADSQHFSPVPL